MPTDIKVGDKIQVKEKNLQGIITEITSDGDILVKWEDNSISQIVIINQ